MEILYDIRQFRYPRPFRIKRAGTHLIDNIEVYSLIKELKQNIKQLKIDEEASEHVKHQRQGLDHQFLTDLATRLWRVRLTMKQTDRGQSTENMKRSLRHLDRLIVTLEENSIHIIDKTGDFYDSGMMMEVVSSEPIKGIKKEMIKETIMPLILYGQSVLQVAQVVIGIPTNTDDDGIGNSNR